MHPYVPFWLLLICVVSVNGVVVPLRKKSLSPRAPSPFKRFKFNGNAVKWDQTCNDPNPGWKKYNQQETKQEAVIRAWEGAMELLADAQTRFAATKRIAKTGSLTNDQKRQQVDQKDPGYTQFFNLDFSDATFNRINDVLGAMRQKINARAQRAQYGDLEILCDEDPSIGCDGGTYAATWGTQNVMNFCDLFFDGLTRFDKAREATQYNSKVDAVSNHNVRARDWDGCRTLAMSKSKKGWCYHDTDAMTVLHEWSHHQWAGWTNPFRTVPGQSQQQQVPAECYEFPNCNKLAQSGNTDYRDNADTYAWYSEYGYFTKRLGVDIWPRGGPNPKLVTV